MLSALRFNELIPHGAARSHPTGLPGSVQERCSTEELRQFPAFRLMRLVRDWVEGYDEAGAGLWTRETPSRLYECVDANLLLAAHAVVGYLSASPEQARLSDPVLLLASCKRYWPPGAWNPAPEVVRMLDDERPAGWSRLAPWWRAAAMLRDQQVDLAALGLHYLWMSRDKLDIAELAAEVSVDDMVRRRTGTPPLHLRTVVDRVLGEDASGWALFERSLLDELSLDFTQAEAYYAAQERDWEQLTGASYDVLLEG